MTRAVDCVADVGMGQPFLNDLILYPNTPSSGRRLNDRNSISSLRSFAVIHSFVTQRNNQEQVR
jgi:hypothetical protein